MMAAKERNLIAFAAAGLLAAFSAAVLVGWQARDLLLVQVHPVFVPMRADSALAMLLAAGGLLALAARWPHGARAAGWGLLAFGLFSLLRFDARFGLQLDQLWCRLGPRFLPSPPEPLGPSPCLCYLLLGGALIILGRRPKAAPTDALAAELLGAGLLVLTALGIFGFWTGFMTVGPYPYATRMALQEVVGFALAGGTVLLTGASLDPQLARAPARRWPAIVGGVCTTATLILWQALSAQDQGRLERMAQFEAANASRELQERMRAQLTPITDLALEWGRNGRPDKKRLEEKAATYIGQHPGCLAVGWQPPAGPLQWIEAVVPPESLARLVENPQGEAAAFLEAARAERQLAAALPGVEGVAARGSFLVYAPIRARDRDEGGIVAVFRLHELLDALLGNSVTPGYALVVYNGSERIYSRQAAETDYEREWGWTTTASVVNLTWRIRSWPTPEVMLKERFSLPRLALGTGFVMAVLLAVAVYLAQTAVRRARELEKEMSERRQAEAALLRSEAKYRCLIENLEHSVFLKDRNLRYVAVNNHFCRCVGREERDLVGLSDDDLYPVERARRHREMDRLVLAEGRQFEHEEQEPGPDRLRTLRVIRTPVRDETGQVTGVLGIVWDVTEQRALEGQLRQAQKMEAIGQLAGGIAHDFNNLLTAVLGNLALLQEELPPCSPGRELAAAAEQAGTRAAHLTRQLLGFSRQTMIHSQPTDLRTTFDEVLAILRRTIDPRISLEAAKPARLWLVDVDPSQMTQVLMNLCINARDAMPDGGRLRLEAENIVLDEEYARLHLEARAGEFVRLRVSDTGTGIPPEVRARIFEPFFTTKEPGKGTGLGLAMVFGIVKQHQGWIDCYSEVGQGTRFDIYLPRTHQSSATASEPVRPPVRTGGTETILLADDEPMIRNLGRAILRKQGYEVLLAEDGQEAVEVFRREKDRIALVILDLTMPRLSGRDAFLQLREIAPDVPVLFASGYSAEQLNEEEQRGAAGFVGKPYRPDTLARKVREVLDGSPPPADEPLPRDLEPASVS